MEVGVSTGENCKFASFRRPKQCVKSYINAYLLLICAGKS
jgi:hypothetical protein